LRSRRAFLIISQATSTTAISTLSLHDALPIYPDAQPIELTGLRERDAHVEASLTAERRQQRVRPLAFEDLQDGCRGEQILERERDRKSTRLNSSHLGISYAVFCLKKKKKNKES